jgi:DNA-binding LytR/AlgR family response regulator
MNILIIEDEKPAARLLQRKVEKLGLKVNTLLHSVEESIEWFQNNNHPDLIFLDIQLSDGLSFEIFEYFDKAQQHIKSSVIFTTAFDEYALRAFKLNSIDYLLKPIDEDELKMAVNKFKNQQQKSTVSNLDFHMIKKMILGTETKEHKTRFSVKIGQKLKVISVDEVECFYSENKGTYLHTFENRNYLLDTTLEQIEEELNPKEFYRLSRKFIVPLKAIKEIQVYSNSRLKVILPTYKDEEVIVSREKVSDFKSWIG